MTPEAIIERARQEGVSMTLTSHSNLTVRGRTETVNCWIPTIQAHKAEIVAILKDSGNEPWEGNYKTSEHRAASCEFDGSLPRKEVEAIAWTEDDRRRCAHCLNRLPNGICKVATPGGLVSANRGYRPDPEVLQRCAGYHPCTDDPDRRLGRERWPGL